MADVQDELDKADAAFRATSTAYDAALRDKLITQAQYAPWRQFFESTYKPEMTSAMAAKERVATPADAAEVIASIRRLRARLDELKADLDAVLRQQKSERRRPVLLARAQEDGAPPLDYRPLPDTRWTADDYKDLIPVIVTAAISILAALGGLISSLLVVIFRRTRTAATALTDEQDEPVKIAPKIEEIKVLLKAPPTLTEAYEKIARMEAMLLRLAPDDADVKGEIRK